MSFNDSVEGALKQMEPISSAYIRGISVCPKIEIAGILYSI